MNDPKKPPTFREILRKEALLCAVQYIAPTINAIVLDPSRMVMLVDGRGAIKLNCFGRRLALSTGATVVLHGLRASNANYTVDRVETTNGARMSIPHTPFKSQQKAGGMKWFVFNENTTCLERAKTIVPGSYADDRRLSAKGVFRTRSGSPMAFFQFVSCEWTTPTWADMTTTSFETPLFSESLNEFGITDFDMMAALLPGFLSADSPNFFLVGNEGLVKGGKQKCTLRLMLADRKGWIRNHRRIEQEEAEQVVAKNPCCTLGIHPWNKASSTTFNVSEATDRNALYAMAGMELYVAGGRVVFGVIGSEQKRKRSNGEGGAAFKRCKDAVE